MNRFALNTRTEKTYTHILNQLTDLGFRPVISRKYPFSKWGSVTTVVIYPDSEIYAVTDTVRANLQKIPVEAATPQTNLKEELHMLNPHTHTPDPQVEDQCATCKQELTTQDEYLHYLADDVLACSSQCLAEYLIKSNEVEEIQ